MRKTLKAVAAATLFAATIGTTGMGQASAAIVSSDMPVKVLYNARQISGDVDPKIIDGAVLVPIRFISDKIGAKIALEGNDVTIVNGKSIVKVTIGSKTAIVDGKSKTLNARVVSENGRTLVPLQAVAGLGISVEWDSMTRYVWVGSKDVPEFSSVAPKAVSLTPYLSYFKEWESARNIDGKPLSTVTIIDSNFFPFKFGDEIFYRYDLARDAKGEQYLKATTTDKGVMATTLFLYSSSITKFRRPITSYRESIGDYRIHYYPILDEADLTFDGDTSWNKFKIGSVVHIGIKTSYESLIFLKNPWR